MSDYRCKVRIIKDRVRTVHAKNKTEAEEEAKFLCKYGWGLPLGEYEEIIEIERANELLEVLRSDS